MRSLLELALAKGAMALALGAASLMASKAGLAQSAGLSVSVDPNVLAVMLMGLAHAAKAWLRGKVGPDSKLGKYL